MSALLAVQCWAVETGAAAGSGVVRLARPSPACRSPVLLLSTDHWIRRGCDQFCYTPDLPPLYCAGREPACVNSIINLSRPADKCSQYSQHGGRATQCGRMPDGFLCSSYVASGWGSQSSLAGGRHTARQPRLIFRSETICGDIRPGVCRMYCNAIL